MAKKLFTGTGVALVTPFRKDYSVDFGALTNLVKHVINNNVDYLVVMGTTSESPTLSRDERSAVVSHIMDVNDGRLPVVLGIGGNNTCELVNTIKETDFTGISGILSVTPYYNKPNQEGLYAHYKQIASTSPVPVILYNVPGRTGCNISAATTLRLAKEFPNIAAIKEASGNFDQIMKIIHNKPKNFIVLSGDDALTMPLISVGVEGVISVVGQAFPEEFTSMINHSLEGNFKEARRFHYRLLEITESLFEEGNPVGVKAALEIKGITEKNVRLPLVKASKNLVQKLTAQIEKLTSVSV